MNSNKIVSAQVVLVAASGARPGPHTRVTSENIREWTPSAETIVRVSGELRDLGFEVGECVGNSMSITGAARLFESGFRTKLRETRRGGVQFADGGDELAAEKIPPDFGPGAGSSFA